MSNDTNPAPGMYPAPHANNELRYWDGHAWQASEPAKKKRKGLWITLGIVGGLIVAGGIGGALGAGQDDTAASTPAPTETASESVATDNEPTAEPVEAAPEPEPEPEPVEPPQPELSLAQQNAVDTARNYLSVMGFSRDGLIDQMVNFDAYSIEDATFAVDHIAPDWNAEAVQSAENYLNVMSFSRQGLVDQLVSFDKYTPEQAEHAATAIGY